MTDFIERMKNYEFDESHHARLKEFKQVIKIPDKFDDGISQLKSVPKEPGIYFWVAEVKYENKTRLYRIYIGKTDSNLRGRLNKYFGDFQPHNVNDFKIQAFHRTLPAGMALSVYVRSLEKQLSEESLMGEENKAKRRARVHHLENEAFQKDFNYPLLNDLDEKKKRNGSFEKTSFYKDQLKDAFAAYYSDSINRAINERNAKNARG